jgi:hypothetical protein
MENRETRIVKPPQGLDCIKCNQKFGNIEDLKRHFKFFHLKTEFPTYYHEEDLLDENRKNLQGQIEQINLVSEDEIQIPTISENEQIPKEKEKGKQMYFTKLSFAYIRTHCIRTICTKYCQNLLRLLFLCVPQ